MERRVALLTWEAGEVFRRERLVEREEREPPPRVQPPDDPREPAAQPATPVEEDTERGTRSDSLVDQTSGGTPLHRCAMNWWLWIPLFALTAARISLLLADRILGLAA